MTTQVQDFQLPASQVQDEPVHVLEHATHYGILVGGLKEIDWNGTGEQSVGHHVIERRKWMTFIDRRVGRRPEYEGAHDQSEMAVQQQWFRNAERIRTKSARACAADVLLMHKAQGYCVPEILIGHPDAQRLAERVWPADRRASQRLFEHIAYFEAFSSDDPDEATLASQLLSAMYACFGWTQDYVLTLKAELNKEKGLKGLSPVLEELFHEINEPLPERKNLAIAQEMGRAVAGDGRKDEAIIGALNAITARLEALEQPGLTEEAKVSNTQPGVTKDGSPDRRFKINKGE